MEVDDAARLVLSDLDEPDGKLAAALLLGHARQAAQVARQVGGEPPPQRGGVQVEQHRGLVVVAVGAHRAAEPGVIVGVPDRAGDVAAVRAGPLAGITAGTARKHGLAPHAPGVDRAERRGGQGGEHARVSRDRFGDALAADEARADELAGIALVDSRAAHCGELASPAQRGRRSLARRCLTCHWLSEGVGQGNPPLRKTQLR